MILTALCKSRRYAQSYSSFSSSLGVFDVDQEVLLWNSELLTVLSCISCLVVYPGVCAVRFCVAKCVLSQWIIKNEKVTSCFLEGSRFFGAYCWEETQKIDYPPENML